MKQMKSVAIKSGQAGFTLIELIIGMSIITLILLATGVFSFSGAQSKATNMLSIAKDLGDGALRYNANTGLFPKAPVSLFDKTKNTATDTFQGVNATAGWQGPYVSAFGADASGNYKMDAYVAGSTISFAQITTGLPSGATIGYESIVNAVPAEIGDAIVNNCNGTAAGTALPADHSTGTKCSGVTDATTGLVTVHYLFTSM